MTKVFAVVLAVSVLWLGGGAARAADSNAEKARAHFQQGDTYFKLDKYSNALQEFEQAYLAKQDPSFLYNIAQCHRLMGNRVEAIRFYKRYLADAPGAPNRSIAEKHIHDLETALSAEELTGARPAVASPPKTEPATGVATAITPPPAASHPNTAPPPLALEARPPPPSSTDAVLTNPPAALSPDQDHPIYTRWWFWTAVGGVVVTGILLAVFLNRDPSCPADRHCQ